VEFIQNNHRTKILEHIGCFDAQMYPTARKNSRILEIDRILFFFLYYLHGGQTNWHSFLYALTLPNINRFSKLFHS